MPYVSCEWCGESTYKTPWRLKRAKHIFCGNDCWHQWQNRNHKPNTACEWCGTEFFKIPALKRRDEHHCCSRDCYTAWQGRNKVEFTCETCGKSFWLPPSAPKYFACRFCSRECAGNAEAHVWLICDHCGISFSIPPSRLDSARYCSAECKQLHEQDRVELVCQQCGQTYEVQHARKDESKFCSLDCRIAYYESHKSPLYDQIEVVCEWCGSTYNVKPGKVESTRFCSRECLYAGHSEAMSGENHPNWKGGPLKTYGGNWLHQRRRAVERDGECRACGSLNSPNGQGLDVHHIIPIREFDGNWRLANRLVNLISLCRTCHAAIESGELECPVP